MSVPGLIGARRARSTAEFSLAVRRGLVSISPRAIGRVGDAGRDDGPSSGIECLELFALDDDGCRGEPCSGSMVNPIRSVALPAQHALALIFSRVRMFTELTLAVFCGVGVFQVNEQLLFWNELPHSGLVFEWINVSE